MYPAGAITVNGASATNDIGRSPGNTDAITVPSGSLLSVISAGQPVVAETMESWLAVVHSSGNVELLIVQTGTEIKGVEEKKWVDGMETTH